MFSIEKGLKTSLSFSLLVSDMVRKKAQPEEVEQLRYVVVELLLSLG